MSRPEINVTPLIDVLLVLLIIFMCVAPLKPRTFQARIPTEQRNNTGEINIETLEVAIAADHSLRLNTEAGLGTTAETEKLIARLRAVFAARVANGDISDSF